MKGILGTKIGMTQIFEKSGRLIPVTILHVEENQVVSVKTKEKDGYDATLLGFKKIDAKKLILHKEGYLRKIISIQDKCCKKFVAWMVIQLAKS